MSDDIQPSGPTEHLNTVEYWRQLYLDAVAEGQRWQPVLTAARKLREEALVDDDMDDSAFYEAVGDVTAAIEALDGRGA